MFLHGQAKACYNVLCLMVIWISVSCGFNLDITSPILANGQNGSYFGISVALHREGSQNMLIVGAPRDDASIDNRPLRGTQVGEAYRCILNPQYQAKASCEPFNLEIKVGNDFNKTNQWLGILVRSSGPDGYVMVCAPFFTRLVTGQYNICGKCFSLNNNFTASKGSTICTETTKGLLGMAGYINQEGTIVLGAPAYNLGTGRAYLLQPDMKAIKRRYTILDGNYQIQEGYNGAMLGYSVAMGTFFNKTVYIAGSPRSENLYGSVVLFIDGHTIILDQLKGDQLGSYFGHNLIVADLNADGLDDLVVGAPCYWDRVLNKVNVGNITVFYQQEQSMDFIAIAITGKVENGRFGFSTTSIGDINDDGVNDLAVGAPYDGDGAVFIYHGRRSGKINTVETQVLRAEEFNHGFKNFGYALAGGIDADNNSCPDILVGDYASDTVLLIRTKPIIRLVYNFTFDRPAVNLSIQDMDINNESRSGFSLMMCVNYTGVGSPDSYNISFMMKADAEKTNFRATFFHNNVSHVKVNFPTVVIPKDVGWCTNLTVALNPIIRDTINPIIIKVTATPLIPDDLSPGELVPVMDPSGMSSQRQITVIHGCMNPQCTPRLRVHVDSNTLMLYMGDTSRITLNISVQNDGDHAFEAKLLTGIHESLKFSTYNAILSDLTLICEEDALNSEISCDIGNPMLSGTILKFDMTFDIPTVPGDAETLELRIHAVSSNEMSEYNNSRLVKINLYPKIEVTLNGSTNQKNFIYNDTKVDPKSFTYDSDAGKELIHTYWMQNRGPGTIHNATLEVSWPMKTKKDGDYLLYLTNISLSTGDTCDVIGATVNPEKLTILDAPKLVDVDEKDNKTIVIVQRRRRKRMNVPQNSTNEATLPKSMALSDSTKINVINCSTEHGGCVKIICSIENVPKYSDNVVLIIKSRLWDATLKQDNFYSWELVSSASLTVHHLPYIKQPSDIAKKTMMLSLLAVPETIKEEHPTPLWAILLSIVIGVSILILIIIILWKIGFFKRKKVGDFFDNRVQQDTVVLEEADGEDNYSAIDQPAPT